MYNNLYISGGYVTDDLTNIEDPLENSICKKCKFMVDRTIIPLDEGQFDINRSELNIAEDANIYIRNYLCELLMIDLDHIVIKCDRFKDKEIENLIKYEF